MEVIQKEDSPEIDEPGFNKRYPSLSRATESEEAVSGSNGLPSRPEHVPGRPGLVRIYPYGIARTRLERAIREGTLRRFHGNDWIAEAASKNIVTEEEAKQLAERDVRTSYANYSSAMAELSALQRLIDASERNYSSQKKDYELGVVTNLEVLRAIRSLQDARRSLLRAEATAHINLARLRVNAGGIQ